MRLFLSIDLPSSLTEAIEDVQADFDDAAGLDFVDPSQAHVTLKFLGDTDPDRLDDLEAALSEAVADAGVDPFRAEIGGLGVFPSPEYISVLWVGVREGSAEMTALHEALEAAAVERGFDPEEHEFTPHVTLARMNDARGKDLVQRLVEEEDPTVGAFRVAEVRLAESTLTEDGPEYETVARYPL